MKYLQEIRPSDIYQEGFKEVLRRITEPRSRITGFRPPRKGERYLPCAKDQTNYKYYSDNVAVLPPDSPRFILAGEETEVEAAWE